MLMEADVVTKISIVRLGVIFIITEQMEFCRRWMGNHLQKPNIIINWQRRLQQLVLQMVIKNIRVPIAEMLKKRKMVRSWGIIFLLRPGIKILPAKNMDMILINAADVQKRKRQNFHWLIINTVWEQPLRPVRQMGIKSIPVRSVELPIRRPWQSWGIIIN